MVTINIDVYDSHLPLVEELVYMSKTIILGACLYDRDHIDDEIGFYNYLNHSVVSLVNMCLDKYVLYGEVLDLSNYVLEEFVFDNVDELLVERLNSLLGLLVESIQCIFNKDVLMVSLSIDKRNLLVVYK